MMMFFKDLIQSVYPYRAKILCAGVIALYQILAVSLWKGGDGLPYVMDGNENWSNAGHAKNMVDYGWEGFKKSWGLADEVAEMSGKHPEAHPVIYSHGGEFPRIWITLLYLLGIVSVSQQILITAVIIGGVAVFFAYWVFEHLLDSPVWAAVACGFMLTDYIGIMQWMVNTWRAWQIFAFYGSIYYVVLLLRRPSNWGIQLLGGFMAFSLFYAEPVFAIFTGLSVAIFFLISKKVFSWRNLNCLMQLKGFALGAVIAVLLFATQLIGYYGCSNLLKDIRFTIASRNFADKNEADKSDAQRIELYAKNNVMFMPNFETGKSDRKIDYVLKNILGGGVIQVPYLCLTLAGLVLAMSIVRRVSESSKSFDKDREILDFDTIPRIKISIVFFALWFIYISAFYRYGNFCNWATGEQLIRENSRGMPGLLIGSFFLGIFSGSLRKGSDKKKLFMALVLVILSSIAVQAFKPIESVNYSSIFKEKHAVRLAYFWGCLLLPLVALSKRPFGDKEIIKASGMFFAVLCAGFLLNFIFAGYLKTGYISRCCPLISFGFFPVLAVVLRSSSNTYISSHPRWLTANWVGLAITGLLVIEWAGASLAFVQLLPPHGAESIRWIAQNCAGQVIVTQNYAMPYAYETKGSATYCLPDNILRENETPRPVKLDGEKTWIRQSDLIPGLEKPKTLVEFKQNHTLYGWASNLDALIEEEKEWKTKSIDNRQSKATASIFKKNEPNNHFEVFKLNWEPIPTIVLSNNNPEGFFRAGYPLHSGGYARPLRTLELKNICFKKNATDSSVKIKDAGTGMAIIQKGQNPTQFNPTPVLRKNNDNMMLYGMAEYADQLSEEGDSKISLYSVADTNKKGMNERKQDYYELELLAEASAKVGLNPPLANSEEEYVIGYQPIAKDGRKGLVYLSRPFRLSGVGIIQSSAR